MLWGIRLPIGVRYAHNNNGNNKNNNNNNNNYNNNKNNFVTYHTPNSHMHMTSEMRVGSLQTFPF